MATAVDSPKSARELYRIAKRQGVWDPEQIPVAEDRADWERLPAEHRAQLLKVCSLFYEGEVSVADTLAWWLIAMPDLDRRTFLASQLFEEVKHAEFFGLYFREVLGEVDTSAYLVPAYRSVLVEELRERGRAIGRAVLEVRDTDGAELERALVLGMTHYMGVIEGVMAVTGYDYFEEALTPSRILPRLLQGIRLIRADEGHHITAGMDFLRERLAARPELAEAVAQLFFEEAQRIPARTDFIFETNPFGLDRERMMAIAYQHGAQRSREIGLS